MSSYGFVYILTNDYMPGIYKLGCTERSPHTRCEELGKSSGVPWPFRVLCYIEVDNFQSVERDLHKWLGDSRVSPDREFFEGSLIYAIRLLYWLPKRLSFVAPGQPGDPPLLWGFQGCGTACEPQDLPNPWARKSDEPFDDSKAGHGAEVIPIAQVQVQAQNGEGS